MYDVLKLYTLIGWEVFGDFNWCKYVDSNCHARVCIRGCTCTPGSKPYTKENVYYSANLKCEKNFLFYCNGAARIWTRVRAQLTLQKSSNLLQGELIPRQNIDMVLTIPFALACLRTASALCVNCTSLGSVSMFSDLINPGRPLKSGSSPHWYISCLCLTSSRRWFLTSSSCSTVINLAK